MNNRMQQPPKYAKELENEMKHMIIYLQDKTDVCRSARKRSNRGLPYAIDGSFFDMLQKQRETTGLPPRDHQIENPIPWHKAAETFIYEVFGEGITDEYNLDHPRIGCRPWYRRPLEVVPMKTKHHFMYDTMKNCKEEAFHPMMMELSKIRLERKLSDLKHFAKVCKNREDTWSKLDSTFTGLLAFLVDSESYAIYKEERIARLRRLHTISEAAEKSFESFLSKWNPKEPGAMSRTEVKSAWDLYEMQVTALKDYMETERETIGHVEAGSNVLFIMPPLVIFNLCLWWKHDSKKDVATWLFQ